MRIRRRDFITLLSGAAAWPLSARAQQAAMPVIGYLSSLSSEAPVNAAAFRQGLAETGFIEGRNITIDYRAAEGHVDKLAALAAGLVRRGVAVIVAPGNGQGARAAKEATASIPIVFSMGADPVPYGLVTNLHRPGGNITGFTEMATELAPKRLGLMHELMPGATHFALLVEVDSGTLTSEFLSDLQAAASVMGGKVEILRTAGKASDIDATFANLAQRRVDAVLVSNSGLFYALRSDFALLTVRHGVPAIYWDRAFPDAGGLMSYGSSVTELFRQVGIYAGRILKGEKPGDLPVQRATKFDLVINLKAARALRIDVPPLLLARADEVIE
jgi:putative tryptophan/tyrosine transport system substrate-binding protein